MKPLRVIICDSNTIDRESYALFISRLGQKHEINLQIKEMATGESLIQSVENPAILDSMDIIFMDVELSGISGVETAKQVREKGYAGAIIFLTNSTEYYEEAFDVKAGNYIKKGKENLQRLEKAFLTAAETAMQEEQRQAVFFCAGRYRQVSIAEIRYFEVNTGIITVHYGAENTCFEFSSTLTRIEDQFRLYDFVRVHRCYIVSLHYVEEVDYTGITMKDGTVIPVGRKYLGPIKELISQRADLFMS